MCLKIGKGTCGAIDVCGGMINMSWDTRTIKNTDALSKFNLFFRHLCRFCGPRHLFFLEK